MIPMNCFHLLSPVSLWRAVSLGRWALNYFLMHTHSQMFQYTCSSPVPFLWKSPVPSRGKSYLETKVWSLLLWAYYYWGVIASGPFDELIVIFLILTHPKDCFPPFCICNFPHSVFVSPFSHSEAPAPKISIYLLNGLILEYNIIISELIHLNPYPQQIS